MAKRRPTTGTPSSFRPGDKVVLSGTVTLVSQNDRGDELITVAIKGYISVVTVPARDVTKV